MEPAEAEFLAEKELVTIVPSFSMDRVHLIGVSGTGRGGTRPGGGWDRSLRERGVRPGGLRGQRAGRLGDGA